MAHYAFIDENSIVIEVITGRDENEIVDDIRDWEAYYANMRGFTCKRTSYNTSGGIHYTGVVDENDEAVISADQSKALRKNYAGIGFTYDEARDAFIPPKPFDSWVLNEDTCLWEAPVPMPVETDADGNPVPYVWDEDAGDWVVVDG